MASLLLRICAVPFGYTSDLIDSDLVYGDECVTTAEMNWRNLHSSRGLAPLPDVVLSNAPTPSPLRRAHSYLSFFPDKNSTTPALPPTTSALNTHPATTTTTTTPSEALGIVSSIPTRAVSTGRLDDKERDAVKKGLEHIREIRRRLQNEHPQPDPYHALPQLSWFFPRPPPHHPPNHPPQCQGEEERAQGLDGEEEHPQAGEEGASGVWRRAGRDLRRVADNFQSNSAKVGNK
ncbi:uncharacterized protein LOC121866083 isoform X2 [Homarus americanus]|uniref:uncharacterized protein LOC121866083 isoform X2 n=1 Tax=Homarus americanus TaxID=6706 RepID=UPI001C4857B3|nr:uncharacterized protein LOC121866083 isoform X2 [Homarus americanus]